MGNFAADNMPNGGTMSSASTPRFAGWAAILLALLLLVMAAYAWRAAAAGPTQPKGVSTTMQHTNADRPDGTAGQSAGTSGSTQLHVNTTTNGGDNAAPSRSHISASVGGGNAATVVINGEATHLSPGSSVDRTITSNSNSANLNVSVNSSSSSDTGSSSSLSIQMNNDVTTEGGQQ